MGPVRIAIFDYKVIRGNPSGSCHRRLLEGLCLEHEFTVFAVEFDSNPCPDRITWVRVPVPTRPLVLLFVTYHLVAPLAYLAHKLRSRVRYDLVQRVENNLSFGHVGYIHFCHRAFLSEIWPTMKARGARAKLRWLDHFLHALLEGVVYRRTRHFVVPSDGLAQELKDEYPFAAASIIHIPNPIEVERLAPPSRFDRGTIRRERGFFPDDVVLAFTALGQFERKGLPLVLEALAQLPSEVKLIVLGGSTDLVRVYERRAAALGLSERTGFLGMKRDVRPFLWASDAFIFPSFYEVFSLSAHEAAAARLPIITTHVHGVTDVFVDGQTGYFVEPAADSIAAGIRRFTSLSPAERAQMGQRAQEAVRQFDPSTFVHKWREFYNAFADGKA
jgi:glycosyltransferase involved in cell wall biosynthesis